MCATHVRSEGYAQIASRLAKGHNDRANQHKCYQNPPTVVQMSMLVLRVLVGRYQRFAEIYRLHLQGNIFTLKMKAMHFPETSVIILKIA